MHRRFFVVGMQDSEIAYLFRDSFSDAAAAGSVNNTAATPGPGNRVIVDTANHYSVGSGVLSADGGSGSAGNPGYWTPASYARAAGKTVLGEVIKSCVSGSPTGGTGPGIGWDDDQTGNFRAGLEGFGYQIRDHASGAIVGDIPLNKRVALAAIMRPNNGGLMFVKGGSYRYWTFVGNGGTATVTPLYGAIWNKTAIFTCNDVKIIPDLLLISALASDSFDRTNGAIGNTDGLGHLEQLGGSGIAWASVGTWTVATNRAACSALSGGLGIATVECGKADIVLYVNGTRTSAGNFGAVIRYVDANNYIRVLHDGTNITVTEKVAGTDNVLIAATSAPYAADRVLEVVTDGVEIRVRYNALLIGRGQINSALTGTKHGIYTDDLGNTFNNFSVFARGSGGEYESLLAKYTNYHDTISAPSWSLTAYNPYATARANTYKGALHNHSTNSDGVQTIAAVAAGYAGAGYVFLGLSDHDKISADPSQAGLTWLTGTEESADIAHFGCYGATQVTASTDPQTILDFHANDFIVINHPTDTGTPFPPANAKLTTGYHAVEVYNSRYGAPGDLSAGYSYVDDLLSMGDRRVFLVTGEDSHDITHASAYKTAVMVHADTNTAANILASLKAGNYWSKYIPAGQPDIATLTVTLADGVITATTDDTSTITFIGRYGTTLKTESGTSSQYTVAAGDKYVRVLVTRGTSKAWSNPIWF